VSSRLLAGLLLLVGAAGPFDIPLFSTSTVPTAKGTGRLLYSSSPFGVALTADGVATYDVRIELSGLPDPASLGAFKAYVAWAVTSDLSRWDRLGPVANGTTTVGQAKINKFLLVITAEADSGSAVRAGPTILHGSSPSSWLQSFVSHPLFRGIPPQ
jgi:hypothetical protein